jgi:hypothetical protein
MEFWWILAMIVQNHRSGSMKLSSSQKAEASFTTQETASRWNKDKMTLRLWDTQIIQLDQFLGVHCLLKGKLVVIALSRRLTSRQRLGLLNN